MLGKYPKTLFGLVLASFLVAVATAQVKTSDDAPKPVPAPVFTNSLGMPFVPVPETKVLFCIWETRVRDYQPFAKATSTPWEKLDYVQGDTHPVIVSWDDAKLFCIWLTKADRRQGLISAEAYYRLPTDAEWSYAVGIGGQETGSTPREKNGKLKGVYPWGTQWPPPAGAGNLADMTMKLKHRKFLTIEGYDDDFAETAPVGSFKPNRFGLYDLAGNVWEWCDDSYDDDPRWRVLRGGAWYNEAPVSLLSSFRRIATPPYRNEDFGFRVVLAGASVR